MPGILQLDDLIAEINENRDPVDYELMQTHQDRLIAFHGVMSKDPAVPPEDLQMISKAIDGMEWCMTAALYWEMKKKTDAEGDEWEAAMLKLVEGKKKRVTSMAARNRLRAIRKTRR
jgi:hypothetical protein